MRCVLLFCLTACTSTTATTTVPCTPTTNAPTYTELFSTYFAPNTPGHCATAGCHADPNHDTWLCGTTKTSCYAGMVGVGLIDPTDLAHSLIADPERSPLAWIAPAGNMPFDAPTPFPEGRDAITAWVAACAQDN